MLNKSELIDKIKKHYSFYMLLESQNSVEFLNLLYQLDNQFSDNSVFVYTLKKI